MYQQFQPISLGNPGMHPISHLRVPPPLSLRTMNPIPPVSLGNAGDASQQPPPCAPPPRPAGAARPPQALRKKDKEGWDEPSQHILERHGIFYSGTFPSNAGLPKSCTPPPLPTPFSPTNVLSASPWPFIMACSFRIRAL